MSDDTQPCHACGEPVTAGERTLVLLADDRNVWLHPTCELPRRRWWQR